MKKTISLYKMSNKKLGVALLAGLLIFTTLAFAQTLETYQIYFNYKNTEFGESLSIINLTKIAEPSPDYSSQPDTGYRLEFMDKSGAILKLIRFNAPKAGAKFKGVSERDIIGNDNDMNFSMNVPFVRNAHLLRIYNKNNIKIIDIPLDIINKINPGQKSMEVIGVLEVYHSDNFDNPQNSRGYYTLRTEDDKRYSLIPFGTFPNAKSGYTLKVTGKFAGGSIVAERTEIVNTPEEISEPNKSGGYPFYDWLNGLGILWVYGLSIITIIFIVLMYIRKSNGKMRALDLQQYIKSNLKKGFSKEKIRNALIKNNYKNHEIEEAFRGMK